MVVGVSHEHVERFESVEDVGVLVKDLAEEGTARAVVGLKENRCVCK